jgi:hypothetical protein
MYVPTKLTACPPASIRTAMARPMLPVPMIVTLTCCHFIQGARASASVRCSDSGVTSPA